MLDAILSAVLAAFAGSIAGAVVGTVIGKTKNAAKKDEAIRLGLQNLLRAEMIRQHEKYVGRDYCPVYAKDALTAEYTAYHALGGNGVITRLYQEIMELSEEEKGDKNGTTYCTDGNGGRLRSRGGNYESNGE